MSGKTQVRTIMFEETAMAIENMQIAPTQTCEIRHALEKTIEFYTSKARKHLARFHALRELDANSPQCEWAQHSYQECQKRLEHYQGELNSIPACGTPDVCSKPTINAQTDPSNSDDDTGFTLVHKRKAGRNTATLNQAEAIKTSNKFANLNTDENLNNSVENDPQETKEKTPPLMLKFVKDYNKVLQRIHEKFGHTENRLGNNFIKIYPKDNQMYTGNQY
ncbi:hypothetical protein HNY73_007821 [Argiope bruennichi]|uniref:Uncharacterized protein n=1 Tax=Argiope bruennichi TaxID=94029 RepID=A0A8T0FK64_ARGBR|nr:hypothetical protein HNY73_007821 [Argiope bruennichi]